MKRRGFLGSLCLLPLAAAGWRQAERDRLEDEDDIRAAKAALADDRRYCWTTNDITYVPGSATWTRVS